MKLLQTLFHSLRQNLANLLSLFFITSISLSFAQELNCRVVVNTDQLQTQEKQIFEELQTQIYEFMNYRHWTDHEYKPEEKINCSLVIQVTSMSSSSGGQLSAIAQIQSSRPIYGVDYETQIFNFSDKNFNFDYQQSQELNYNENSYITNITSLLAYYAYVIIGYDYDSFSPLGGTQYFNKARDIVNNAQQSSYQGWQAFQDVNNRYWLVDNMLNAQFEPFRKITYRYNREVLDTFSDPTTQKESQEKIIGMFEEIQKIRNIVPTSVLLNTYFFTKGDEFVNIFKTADMQIKMKAYSTLRRIDPSNSDVYQKMMQ